MISAGTDVVLRARRIASTRLTARLAPALVPTNVWWEQGSACGLAGWAGNSSLNLDSSYSST